MGNNFKLNIIFTMAKVAKKVIAKSRPKEGRPKEEGRQEGREEGCPKEGRQEGRQESHHAAEKSEVVSFWDGMYNSNEGFWSHEWSKHGTCWDPSKGDLSKMPAALQDHIKSSRDEASAGKSL